MRKGDTLNMYTETHFIQNNINFKITIIFPSHWMPLPFRCTGSAPLQSPLCTPLVALKGDTILDLINCTRKRDTECNQSINKLDYFKPCMHRMNIEDKEINFEN